MSAIPPCASESGQSASGHLLSTAVLTRGGSPGQKSGLRNSAHRVVADGFWTDAVLPDMKYKRTPTRTTRQDLAQDRAFWRDLLARRTSSRGLPAHSAGGYRNRRFAIIRDAAWITLYRATLPFPQVGVFLRCAGLAGEAFFTLADRARPEIEPLLRAELGPDLTMEWGTSRRPGMTDIAATLEHFQPDWK